MSHKVVIATEIKSLELLGKAAKNLGTTLVAEQKEIKLYKETALVEAYINIVGSYSHAIGFKKIEDLYEIIGDFSDINRNSKFIQDLKQQYALEVTKKKIHDQGLTILSIDTTDLGEIVINIEGE